MEPVPVVLGISEPYVRDKLLAIFRERPEYSVRLLAEGETTDNHVGLQWVEYEDIAFDVLIGNPEGRLCNAYCIRKGLIRKAQLAYLCRKHVAKRPDSILSKAVPETYAFELDDPYYFEEAMNDVFEVAASLEANLAIDNPGSRTRLILKPSLADKAAETLVFDTERRLREFFESRYEAADGDVSQLREWVIQGLCGSAGFACFLRWVDRSVTLIGPSCYAEAASFMFSFTMECLPCSHPNCSEYNLDNLDDRLSHITNTCVQAEKDDFAENDVVRAFWSLSETAEIPHADLERCFEQIKLVVRALFDAVSNEVTVFQPLRNAFELFGLDFLVDEHLTVYLLEANAFPDFKQTGQRLERLIDQLFRQTVAVAVDPYFGLKAVVEPCQFHLVLEKETMSR